MIRLEQVHLFREQRHILNGIDLHLRPGEHWALLGRNGSGKTTILEMMTGYMFPSSGKVEVLGHEYGKCDVREVRKSIGYLSQSLLEKLNLADPVWEVVATGEYGFLRFYEQIDDTVREKALAALEQVHLGRAALQPLGTLSQGERKKVMLARALMRQPRLLVLDEPCSGLDLFEREKLLETISEVSRNDVQLVYVTHHIEELIPLFTHAALMREGRIIASGDKKKVLTSDTLRQAYDVSVRLEWEQNRPWVKVE